MITYIMARVIMSTYEKAVKIKEQRGEIMFLSRESTTRIDTYVSHSFNKIKKRRNDKK